jgi:tetratricopeptide (TPR) repeat protein
MRIAMLAACSLALSGALFGQTISLAQVELAASGKTLGELWSAVAGNPKSAEARAEVGFALLSMNRLQQAEWAARESLTLDPSSARAQLLLGWTLAREYRYTAEALDCLSKASRQYPQAHLGAAEVLEHQGSVAGAQAELEAYLANPDAEHRKIAGIWLQLLRKP